MNTNSINLLDAGKSAHVFLQSCSYGIGSGSRPENHACAAKNKTMSRRFLQQFCDVRCLLRLYGQLRGILLLIRHNKHTVHHSEQKHRCAPLQGLRPEMPLQGRGWRRATLPYTLDGSSEPYHGCCRATALRSLCLYHYYACSDHSTNRHGVIANKYMRIAA